MGEARRWKEERAAMEAAYRLGGDAALKALIEPNEVVRCPMCEHGIIYRKRTNYEIQEEAAERIRLGMTATEPMGGFGPDLRTVCFLCKGKGGIQRVVKPRPPRESPRPDLDAAIVHDPLDALSCVEWDRWGPNGPR